MQFQLVPAVDGTVDPNTIIYQDENAEWWVVPEGHRFWTLYQQWISEGNTPLPAN